MSFGYLNNNINSNYFQAQAAAAALPTPSPPVQRKPTPFITPPERSPLTWRRCSSQHDSNEQSFSFEPQPPPLPLLLPPASDVPKFAEIKRQHKQNPVIMSREDVREKRRAMFLSKVKDAREHSRIQSRGGEDEMMRVVLISDHRRWHAELARAASSIPTIEEETEIQLLREEENLYYLDLMEEQDRELEAILSQLDIHDGDDKLGDAPGELPLQAGACLQQQPTQYERTAACGGCRNEGSMLLLEGVHVCFCCGWSPQ